MRDARLDGLIKKALSARTHKTKAHCVNGNLMAAYLEASLSDRETSEFEAHVAECQECQEVLALSMKLQDLETAVRPVPSQSGKKTLFHFSMPIPALGAVAAAILLLVVFLRWGPNSGESIKETQVAELREPVQKAETDRPVASIEHRAEAERTISVGEKARTLEKRVPDKAPEGQVARPAAETKKEDRTVADLRIEQAVPPSPSVHAIAPVGSAGGVAEGETRTESATVKPQHGLPDSDAELQQVAPTETAEGARGAVTPAPRERQRDAVVTGMLSGQAAVAFNAAPSANEVFKGKDLSDLSTAESRKVGDKVFYLNSGIWIDIKSAENRNDDIIEILRGVPEYEKILARYPEARELIPLLIRWDGKNYLLR